jgi:ubiquitin C-terminal hydrolase
MVNQVLSQDTDQMKHYSSVNRIIEELILLNNLPNLSYASTEKLRSIVNSMCEISGQTGRTFNDNLQHDAGEFLVSMFEHLFKDSNVSNNIDEQIFGGLYQEKIVCKCGNVKYLPVQKLSEILMIQLNGQSIQSCLMNFLSDDDIRNECTKCENNNAVKTMKIVTEPSTLIIQLKRYKFDIDGGKITKRHDEIKCEKSLTMPSGSTFTLSSVVNHEGINPTEGHYNVLIYDHINCCYILLDDLNVIFDVKNNYKISKSCYIVTFTKDV